MSRSQNSTDIYPILLNITKETVAMLIAMQTKKKMLILKTIHTKIPNHNKIKATIIIVIMLLKELNIFWLHIYIIEYSFKR